MESVTVTDTDLIMKAYMCIALLKHFPLILEGYTQETEEENAASALRHIVLPSPYLHQKHSNKTLHLLLA